MLSRRRALTAGAAFAGALAASGLAGTRAGAAATSARGTRRIPYGACVNLAPLQDQPDYRIALDTYCQQLTPEYGLVWDYVQPSRGRFNFDYADKVASFADLNEMTMRGHTLVWYSSLPNWLKDLTGAVEVERELADHIERVVSRYRGHIKTWHVVNEPIDNPPGGTAGLRSSFWLQRLGPKYIDTAFRLAHRADPNAELLINEYDIECVGEPFAARRQALLSLIRDLVARGVPVNGVGLQGHIRGSHQIDQEGVSRFVAEVTSLGLSVHVTELDVIDNELPGPIAVRDVLIAARAHDFLAAIFAAARPAAIATWGITDRYSWVPTYNKRADGLPNRPLPLDESYRPKPLWSVIDYFCAKSA